MVVGRARGRIPVIAQCNHVSPQAALDGIAGLARKDKASTQVARLAFFFGLLSEIIRSRRPPVYLGRLFKRDLKMSPMRFLRRMRCQRAAKELSSSDLSIAEIAYQAGWIDANLFSRVFNQEMGMSPTKYRASSRLKG